MYAIEWVGTAIACIVCVVIGINIGQIKQIKKIKKHFDDNEFISKYYGWFSKHAESKKFTTDQLKASLLKVATKQQVDTLTKYYYKERHKRIKEEMKDAKTEAIKKKYVDYIDGKVLK